MRSRAQQFGVCFTLSGVVWCGVVCADADVYSDAGFRSKLEQLKALSAHPSALALKAKKPGAASASASASASANSSQALNASALHRSALGAGGAVGAGKPQPKRAADSKDMVLAANPNPNPMEYLPSQCTCCAALRLLWLD